MNFKIRKFSSKTKLSFEISKVKIKSLHLSGGEWMGYLGNLEICIQMQE
jgi:hypothetical protein